MAQATRRIGNVDLNQNHDGAVGHSACSRKQQQQYAPDHQLSPVLHATSSSTQLIPASSKMNFIDGAKEEQLVTEKTTRTPDAVAGSYDNKRDSTDDAGRLRQTSELPRLSTYEIRRAAQFSPQHNIIDKKDGRAVDAADNNLHPLLRFDESNNAAVPFAIPRPTLLLPFEQNGSTVHTDDGDEQDDDDRQRRLKFKNLQQSSKTLDVFRADEPIFVNVTLAAPNNTEKKKSFHHQKITYDIQLEHHNKQWHIFCTFREILKLRKNLKKFISQTNRRRIREQHRNHRIFPLSCSATEKSMPVAAADDDAAAGQRPLLSSVPFFLSSSDSNDSREKVIQTFLREILADLKLRNMPPSLEFLQCSPLTFYADEYCADVGNEFRELAVRKLGGRIELPFTRPSHLRLMNCYDQRWFFACGTFYGYYDAEQKKLLDVQLIDRNFRVVAEKKQSNYEAPTERLESATAIVEDKRSFLNSERGNLEDPFENSTVAAAEEKIPSELSRPGINYDSPDQYDEYDNVECAEPALIPLLELAGEDPMNTQTTIRADYKPLVVVVADQHAKSATRKARENHHSHNSLEISNGHRDITLKFAHESQLFKWKTFLLKLARGPALDYYMPQHPNRSFAPVRDGTACRWYTGGADYMTALALTIEKYAEKEIFITDWWLSPEIFLKRDVESTRHQPFDYWRLDRVLQRAAEKGVKIYIILYKEIEWAMALNSFHTKAVLESRHPENIKVLRHPEHKSLGDVLLWSHHEKTVCIDQKVTFVGGIDLCFGRYETDFRIVDVGNKHFDDRFDDKVEKGGKAKQMKSNKRRDEPKKRSDRGESSQTAAMARRGLGISSSDSSSSSSEADASDSPEPPSAGGQDADAAKQRELRRKLLQGGGGGGKKEGGGEARHSQRQGDEKEDGGNEKKLQQQTNKKEQKQLKTEKVSDDAKKKGSKQASRKHAQNRLGIHLSKDHEHDEDYMHVPRHDEFRKKNDRFGVRRFGRAPRQRRFSDDKDRQAEERELLKQRDDNPEYIRQLVEESGRVWIGKDYYNELRHGWNSDFSIKPYEDYINRKQMPRLPWHDCGAQVIGRAAADVARHFIESWNNVKRHKKNADERYPFLMPKAVEFAQNLPEDLFAELNSPSSPYFRCRTQVLRSISTWSFGVDETENSIQQGYISCIQAAQRFIFIENQFFVSFTHSNTNKADDEKEERNSLVKNCIAVAIVQRLRRAHENNEDFHVYIMLPLLPAIQGKFGTAAGAALQSVVYYIYQSISRPPHALFEHLSALGIPPEKYITFSSLRAHGVLEHEPMTEIVYIHSKTMIIDDRVTIIGSANINDRSMLGYRDSEVCILYTDEEFYDGYGTVRGDERKKKCSVGRFAGSLRRNLWSKYLGVPPDDARIQNPSTEECVQFWRGVAHSNTRIFQDVFTCVPSDEVRTFQQLKDTEDRVDLAIEDPEAAIEKLQREVQGYLVEFPLKFLCDEDLTPVYSAKERYTPAYLFT